MNTAAVTLPSDTPSSVRRTVQMVLDAGGSCTVLRDGSLSVLVPRRVVGGGISEWRTRIVWTGGPGTSRPRYLVAGASKVRSWLGRS